MEDVISVGKTCKQMRQVAGYCFRQTYGDIIARMDREGIHVTLNDTRIDVTHFIESIRKIAISNRDCLPLFLKIQSKLRRLKEMHFNEITLVNGDVDSMSETFGKLETLRFDKCRFEAEFIFTNIIDQCTKLRRLEFRSALGQFHDFEWFTRKYPLLEYLEFQGIFSDERFVTFLELNPNIRVLKTSVDFFWAHFDLYMESSIRLHELSLEFLRKCRHILADSLCTFLNELHENAFYQQLELIRPNTSFSFRMPMLNALVKVQTGNVVDNLTNIEELTCTFAFRRAEVIAGNLVKLRRICLGCASVVDQIIPYIRRSPELQTIEIIGRR